jgi:hypothetical protein
MQHIAASEVKQRLGQYMESALTEPVMIEKSGTDETMRRLQERIDASA